MGTRAGENNAARASKLTSRKYQSRKQTEPPFQVVTFPNGRDGDRRVLFPVFQDPSSLLPWLLHCSHFHRLTEGGGDENLVLDLRQVSPPPIVAVAHPGRAG